MSKARDEYRESMDFLKTQYYYGIVHKTENYIGKLESEKAELIDCLQELYDDHDNYASIACDKAKIMLNKYKEEI